MISIGERTYSIRGKIITGKKEDLRCLQQDLRKMWCLEAENLCSNLCLLGQAQESARIKVFSSGWTLTLPGTLSSGIQVLTQREVLVMILDYNIV